MTKIASLLGEFFEIGFKKKFLEMLPEDQRVKELNKNSNYKTLEEYINKIIDNKLNYSELIFNSTMRLRDYKEDLLYMIKIGKIAAESYLKYMLNIFPSETSVKNVKRGGRKFIPSPKKISNVNITFEKPLFQKEESLPTWKNADVIFRIDNTLYLFELTLYGGSVHFQKFLDVMKNSKKEFDYVIGFDGINIDVGIDTDDIYEVADNILKGIGYFKEKDENAIFLFSVKEIGKLSQALFYLFDYLYEKDVDIDYVYLGVIYSFKDGLLSRFRVSKKDKKEIDKYRNAFKELRDKFRPDAKGEVSVIKDIISLGFEEIIEKINNSEPIEITPIYSIQEIRDDVKKNVEKNKDNYGNVIVLCHSAGAGKTTAIINEFLENVNKKDEAHLFFYFSPRTAITNDKTKTLQKMNLNNVYIIDRELITKEMPQDNSYNDKFHNLGVVVDENYIDYGWMTKASNILNDKMVEGKYEHFAIFLNMQTLMYGVLSPNTIKSLKDSIINFIENSEEKGKKPKVTIVMDEIIASDNGIFNFKYMLEQLKHVKDKVKIYILDANIANGYFFEKILKRVDDAEKMGYDYIPSSIYRIKGSELSKENEEYSFKYRDWEILSYTKAGFIGRSLKVKLDLKFFKNDSEIIKHIVEITLKEKQQILIYVQNKTIANEIKVQLEIKGKKVAIRTAIQSLLDLEEIKKFDVVIGTSSISRGIDVPFKKIYGFFYEGSSEKEIAEFYQVISRLRGIKDENGENIDHFYDREAVILLYRSVYKGDIHNLTNLREEISLIMVGMEEEIYKQIKLVQLKSLANLTISTLEAYINPNQDKEYYLSFPEIRLSKKPLPIGIKDLQEIANYFGINLNIEIEGVVESKKPIVIYPYKIHTDAIYSVSLKREEIEKLKRKIIANKDRLARANDYLKIINEILSKEKKSTSHIEYKLGGLPVAEFLPISVFKLSFKVIRILNKSITRKRYQLLNINPNIKINSEGKLFIALADIPNSTQVFAPRIPLEMFFDIEDVIN